MNVPAGILAASMIFVTCALVFAGRDAARRGSVAARLTHASRNEAQSPRLPSAPRWLERCLRDIGVDWSAENAWIAWLAGASVLSAVALVVGGAGLGVIVSLSCVAGPALAARALRGRGAARLEASLPGALEALARGLRSGASLRQAVDESARVTAGALGSDLARVSAESDRGVPVVEALGAWSERRPLPGVRLAVAALALGAETGGAQARAIDGVAATLRQRLAVAAEARALATQARASAAVIAVAPLVFCALASAADPRLGEFLLRTPLGLLILAGGLGLDAAGALWMARLTRVEP